MNNFWNGVGIGTQYGWQHYNPTPYQQQMQAYQQIAYQHLVPYAPPVEPNTPKPEKYVPEYSWLRGRINEILWKL